MLSRTSWIPILFLVAVGCDTVPNSDIKIVTAADSEKYKLESIEISRPIVNKFYLSEELTDDDLETLDRAIKLRRAILFYDAGGYLTFFALGQLLVVRGHYEEGLRYLQSTLKRVPEPLVEVDRVRVADTLNLQAVAYFKLGSFDKSLLAASAAVDLYPNSPAYLETQAEAMVQLKLYDQAREVVKKVLYLDPTSRKGKRLQRLLADD